MRRRKKAEGLRRNSELWKQLSRYASTFRCNHRPGFCAVGNGWRRSC